jgi:hypothetical protein
MIRDRLEADALHPARLAGTHAWAAWGLTRQADPHHLELAIPARHGDSYARDLLREAAHRLQQPIWPSSAAPPLVITDRRIAISDGERTASLEILDLPWYLPDGAADTPGDAVTVDGWPLIDEPTATRLRFEAIDRDGPTERDVTDIATWVEHKSAQVRTYRQVPTPLDMLIQRTRRASPSARRGIDALIAHARSRGQRCPDQRLATAPIGRIADLLRDQGERRITAGISRV